MTRPSRALRLVMLVAAVAAMLVPFAWMIATSGMEELEVFQDPPPLWPAEFQGGNPGCLAFLSVIVSQWSGTRAHLKQQRPGFLESIKRLEQHPRIEPVLLEHRGAA